MSHIMRAIDLRPGYLMKDAFYAPKRYGSAAEPVRVSSALLSVRDGVREQVWLQSYRVGRRGREAFMTYSLPPDYLVPVEGFVPDDTPLIDENLMEDIVTFFDVNDMQSDMKLKVGFLHAGGFDLRVASAVDSDDIDLSRFDRERPDELRYIGRANRYTSAKEYRHMIREEAGQPPSILR